MPITGKESSLVDVLFFDAYMMISWSQVNLWEHFFCLQLIKQVINPWQRVAILDTHLVQLLVINAQFESTILLIYRQYWYTLGWYTWPYVSFINHSIYLKLKFHQLWIAHPVRFLWCWCCSWYKLKREIHFPVRW